MIKFNSKASSPLKINKRNQFNLKKLKLFLRGTGTQKGSVRAKYKSKGTFSTDFEAIFIPNYGTLCFVMVYFVIYVIFFLDQPILIYRQLRNNLEMNHPPYKIATSLCLPKPVPVVNRCDSRPIFRNGGTAVFSSLFFEGRQVRSISCRKNWLLE
jgi:hypothetical protein